MQSRTAFWVFSVLVILVIAAGTFTWRYLSREAWEQRVRRAVTPDSAGTTPDPRAFEELTAELARLRASVERLEAALRANPSRAAAAAPASEVQPPEAAAPTTPAANAPLLPVVVPRDLVRPLDAERRKALEDIRALPYEEQSRANMFASMSTIVEKYGLPDGAHSDGGTVVLVYDQHDAGYIFRFMDGMLLGTSVTGK